jgi:hypothetical protein
MRFWVVCIALLALSIASARMMFQAEKELAGIKYRERWVQNVEEAKARYTVSRTSGEEAGTKASWEEIAPFLLVNGNPAKESDSSLEGDKLELGTYASANPEAPAIKASYPSTKGWPQPVARWIQGIATLAALVSTGTLFAWLGTNLERWIDQRYEAERNRIRRARTIIADLEALADETTSDGTLLQESPEPPEPTKNEALGPRRRCLEIP